MIPSTRAAERRKHSALPDFLRRTLRLAGVVAGIPLLLLADAAGAAEVRTYYVACGGSENVAQLVPIDAVRTKALDTRKSPPTFAAAFSFPANTDNIATHLGEVAQMLRIAGIPGCESSMRIAGYGGDIIYPRPANLSPYLDTAEARRQQHWTHAEVRYLQERGQGDVITTTDARFTDPGWPLYAVGMVLFFSARNGGDQDTAVIYAWSHEKQRYDRVMEAPDITMANMDDPDKQERLLSYMWANVRVPASIPASGSDPALTVHVPPTFYERVESGVGQCVGEDGSHEAIAQCFFAGNAILLASDAAQSFDRSYGDAKVVGVVRFSGNFYGEVLLWAPDQNKYMAVEPSGTQSYLCRTCLRQSRTQAILHAAMRPNFVPTIVPEPAAVDTSMTFGDAQPVTDTTNVTTDTAPASIAVPDTPLSEPWRAPRWLRTSALYALGVIAIALAVALILFLREQARIAQLRRTLRVKREHNDALDEVFADIRRELTEVRGNYARAQALHDEAVEETKREIRS